MRLARPLPRRPVSHHSNVAGNVLSAAVDAAVAVVVAQVEVGARWNPRLLSRLAFLEAAPAVGLSCFYFSLDLAA